MHRIAGPTSRLWLSVGWCLIILFLKRSWAGAARQRVKLSSNSLTVISSVFHFIFFFVLLFNTFSLSILCLFSYSIFNFQIALLMYNNVTE
jgi:hypothetical protein